MDTEYTRSVSQQVVQTANAVYEQAQMLSNFVQRLDWQSPSRDSWENDALRLVNTLSQLSDSASLLGMRVQREVDEWESVDGNSSFRLNSPAVLPIVIVGGGITLVFGGVLWWAGQDLKNLSKNEAFEKLESILDNTKIGRDALKDAKDLGVSFELSKTGTGTYYDSSTNTMYIDPNTHQDFAVNSFIHELEHAKQHADGLFPDVMHVTKDEYVTKCVSLEADAVIAEFMYEKERKLFDFLNASEKEKAFWDAYNETTKRLEKTSSLSSDEIYKLAYDAGKEKLIKLYENGSIITSTTKESYLDYYGDYWEMKNLVGNFYLA